MTVVSFSMAYRSFRGGSGRLHTRLDTPPLINRRHPDSCLAHLVAGAIIELNGTRAFVGRHRLGVLEHAARFKVSGDPRRAKCVAADPALHAELSYAALDHPPCVDAIHRGRGERAGAAR